MQPLTSSITWAGTEKQKWSYFIYMYFLFGLKQNWQSRRTPPGSNLSWNVIWSVAGGASLKYPNLYFDNRRDVTSSWDDSTLTIRPLLYCTTDLECNSVFWKWWKTHLKSMNINVLLRTILMNWFWHDSACSLLTKERCPRPTSVLQYTMVRSSTVYKESNN